MRLTVRLLASLWFLVALSGQETGPSAKPSAEDNPAIKESDPITDRLRYEIALAQRDYLAARQQVDAAQRHMISKTAEAEKACASQDKTWSADTFACVAGTK